MITEEGSDAEHRHLAAGTGQRIHSTLGDAAVPIWQQGDGKIRSGQSGIWCFLRRHLFPAESTPGLGDIAGLPAGGEEPGVTDHGEVLVRDVADEPLDELRDRQGLVGLLATLRVVAEGEADRLAVVVGDPVLGQHGPLRVASDVPHREPGVEQTRPDVGVPGDVVELGEKPAEGGEVLQIGRGSREAEPPVPMSLPQQTNHVVPPALLQTAVVHEKPRVGRDPSCPVEGQTTSGNEHVDVRMELEVGSERVQDADHPHPHAHAHHVMRPLGDRALSRREEEVEAHFPVHEERGPQLPGKGQHEVVIGHVEQVVQDAVRPHVRGVLSTARTRPRLAGMRDDLHLTATRAEIDVAPQCRRPTRQDAADGLEDHGPNELPAVPPEGIPVDREDHREVEADVRHEARHGPRCSPRPDGPPTKRPPQPTRPSAPTGARGVTRAKRGARPVRHSGRPGGRSKSEDTSDKEPEVASEAS